MGSIYQVTFEDAATFSHEMEQVYECRIIWRLVPTVVRLKTVTVVEVEALQQLEGPMYQPIASRTANYPSVLHKTLGGAILAALRDLEDAIQAQSWLRRMDWKPK